MIDTFLQDILKSKLQFNNGLFLFTPPTGFGKTYSAERVIAEYIDDCVKNHIPIRNVFFLTSQKKQFPDLKSSFVSIFGNDKLYKKYVIELRKNEEYILNDQNQSLLLDMYNHKEKYNQFAKIQTKCKTLDAIITKVQDIIFYTSKTDQTEAMKTYIQKTKEELSWDVSIFLRELEHYFSELISRIEKQKNTSIENKDDYKLRLIKEKMPWLIKLFPAILSKEKKVFVTTMAKFFTGNSTIIQKHYSFIDNQIIKNAIVFIDEFDTTKSDLDEQYNKAAVENTENLIEIFNNIAAAFEKDRFPGELKSYWQKQKYNPEYFRKDALKIQEKYFVDSKIYKTNPATCGKDKIIFYSNNDSRTVCNKMRPYGTVSNDYIYINLKHKKDNEDISIESMLDTLIRYLKRFETFIHFTAQNLSKQNKTLFENELISLLNLFQLGKSETRILKENICRKNLYKLDNDNLITERDFSYYFRGFNTVILEDLEQNKYQTDFIYNKKNSTAEVFMIKLAQKANVIGMSATANLQTLEHYNLSYIKLKLNNDFHHLSDLEHQQILNHVKKIHEEYKNQNIKIIPTILKNISMNKYSDKEIEAKNILNGLFNDKELSNNLYLDIKNNCMESDVDYYKVAFYLNVITAIYNFCKDDNSKLWFIMSTPIIQNKYNINIIYKALEIITNQLKKPEIKKENLIFISGSKDFESKRKTYLSELKKGKKILVFMAYKSAQAGVNLQYENPVQCKSTVQIFSSEYSKNDSRFAMKDADGLVLLDITQKLFRLQTYDDELEPEINKKLKLETLLTKINELREYGIIGEIEKNFLIDAAISQEFNPIANNIKDNINNHTIIASAILQVIMQAVGRLTRSFNKNKTINIMIDENTISKIYKLDETKYYILPELKAIMNLCKEQESSPDSKQAQLERYNELISDTLNQTIIMLTHSSWAEDTYKEYIDMGEKYLTAPTSDVDYNNLYIWFPDKGNSYCYSQSHDFKQSHINMDGNDKKLKQRLKNLCQPEPIINIVSDKSAKLHIFAKHPKIRKYFKEHNYPMTFEPKKFIMPPVCFNNIYKGRIGEIALRVVFQHDFNIPVFEITDLSKFEIFDFDLSNNIYADAKHWNGYYETNDHLIPWAMQKLEHIQGDKVIFVKIIEDPNNPNKDIQILENGKIILVPYLLHEDGTSNPYFGETLRKLIKRNNNDH